VFHVKQAGIQEFIQELGISLSERQLEQLEAYEQILISRGPDVGVVSAADVPRLRERHVLDSARAAAVLPEDGLTYDLGSGGGLPGIPVAILRPEMQVSLVEQRSRRAGFLEWVVEELGLANAEVRVGRIEALAHGSADSCLARAFAPLEGSWAAARPLLKPGGRLVYFAGLSVEVPEDLPGASDLRTQAGEMLDSSGPLVIITR